MQSAALWAQAVVVSFMLGGEHSGNSYVRTDVSLSRQAIHAGDVGAIVVTLAPVKGIHVNVRPQVAIAVFTEGIVALEGTSAQSTDSSTGFLATDVPVQQTFRVLRDVPPGDYVIRGTCTYYFCSDAEGWCTKFSQPVELTLTVMR